MPQGLGPERNKSLWVKLWAFCFSHIGRYVFFGACTTLLNLLLFLFFFHACHLSGWFSNTLAWFPSVIFAWWTNRLWVFDCPPQASLILLLKELLAFSWSRLATGFMDICLIWITVDLAQWNEIAMKVAVGVFIVIANYAISRWWVFKKKEAK